MKDNIMTQQEFKSAFDAFLAICPWSPDPEFSVFTQFDGPTYYEPRRAGFTLKYKTMWAMARTLMPKTIVELGTHAGSSADAYISASGAKYIGYDVFGIGTHHGATQEWNPWEVCHKLFAKRGFKDFRLIKADLRQLQEIERGDLIVVDAAHDFQNELMDLLLAALARPDYIYVDDVNGSDVAGALKVFRMSGNHIEWEQKLDYDDGGLVIKMK